MIHIKDIRLLSCFVGMVLLAACQNEPEPPAGEQKHHTMELVSLTAPFLDVQKQGTTRADYENFLPKDYIPYDQLYPTTTPPNKTIGVFMTPEKESSLGDFIYQGIENGISVWKSTVTVKEGTQYYIYGFMPRGDADRAVISPLPDADTSGPDKGYAKGAQLTIKNYESLTSADVCVLVGVRNATAEEKITGPQSDIKLGNFGYKGMANGENRIFVLLKHIYAGIHFRCSIDPAYHKLRCIRVTKLELIAKEISAKVDLTVKFVANDQGKDPVAPDSVTYTSYTAVGEPETTSTILFPYEGSPEEFEVPETIPESFLGCFVPNLVSEFVLRTTYNVYDKKDNLIRKDNVIENKINTTLIPKLKEIGAGEIVSVNMHVAPDYLYQLSGTDLDNPTISLTTNP
ncbi:MAG: hypothetical protein J6R11_00980 [Bacteroidaceae bacterium]|nr:hypothetical protein [Bacteroidaceae bacterium]